MTKPKRVEVGQPVYHRKRKRFTLPATGDTVHEVNLDYLAYPFKEVDVTKPENIDERIAKIWYDCAIEKNDKWFVNDAKLFHDIKALISQIVDEVVPDRWDYKKLGICPVCGSYEYSHAPDSHYNAALDQLRANREKAGL